MKSIANPLFFHQDLLLTTLLGSYFNKKSVSPSFSPLCTNQMSFIHSLLLNSALWYSFHIPTCTQQISLPKSPAPLKFYLCPIDSFILWAIWAYPELWFPDKNTTCLIALARDSCMFCDYHGHIIVRS